MGRHPLKPLVVLGATGSIGTQTLQVADRLNAKVAAIAAKRGSEKLVGIALRYPNAIVCVTEPGEAADRLTSMLGERVRFGPGALTEVAATPGHTVVNGVVGAAGLRSSLAALYAGNRLALANKESLVAGGVLISKALADGGGELIPVDSEHSAIYQCIIGEPDSSVRRVVLTASGGPFRGWSRKDLEGVTVAQALEHPTWSMGPRITTDSATLMNKAFEVIEAHFLFGTNYDAIDVVVHPQSIVHSFVEFSDGVVKAEVGFPDMMKPIQYAITAPERVESSRPGFSIAGHDLTFEAPDVEVFPCLTLGYEAGRMGGTAPAALNAADEVAVARFLEGRIAFTAIADVVGTVLHEHQAYEPGDVSDVESVDREARARAIEVCTKLEMS
ncbi:MAG: 1-deoxy-D-xylulose-5-phosphate reductoisomerase [Actinomycetia bacterium]|nr:1-deoxy-D-xylulose-5-phosphate reductoisomerase [Actinomycetes bacterium]